MRKKALSSHMPSFLSLIVVSLASFFWGRIAAAQVANQNEVKSDALTVYSEMSTTSSVVKTLKKGTRVIIRLQVTGAEGAWCKIAEGDQTNSLGYVLCSQLLRAIERQGSKPTSQMASVPVISGSAGAQISGTPRTGSFITSFERETIRPARRDPNIAYDLDPRERRCSLNESSQATHSCDEMAQNRRQKCDQDTRLHNGDP
jgi:hypothetical protein